MKIKYIHLRAHDIASPYLDDLDSRGGVTIAYLSVPEDNKVFWSVARCHPKDNYNKALGRTKATGKLKQKDVNFVIYTEALPSNKEIVNHLKEMIYFDLEARNPDIRHWLY